MIPADFHFLRPLWLLGFLPLSVIMWRFLVARRTGGNWRAVCDAALLPFVLLPEKKGRVLLPVASLGVAGTLALLALAGPSWERIAQPVFSDQSALVIVADLSRSMDAEDVKPSRLTRMRHKITDLLERRDEGQTALVVFAGDAFVVTPLTEDTGTIAAMVPVLETRLMPTQGGRADRGIAIGMELLTQSGYKSGSILLITDGVRESHVRTILDDTRDANVTISVLAVGTEHGAPISTGDGFLKDRSGTIVVAKLDDEPLKRLARSSNGRYAVLTPDDSDLDAMVAAFENALTDSAFTQSQFVSDVWVEAGPWFILPLILLVSIGFRRGVIACLALLIVLPNSRPAYAGIWEDAWRTRNQQGMAAINAEDPARAAELFENKQWQAAAQYEAGEFEEALNSLEGFADTTSQYNRGNALARLGRFEEAIDAYDKTLTLDPDNEDAQHNRDLLEQLQQQQQQQQNSQDGSQEQDAEQQNAQANPQNDEDSEDSSREQAGQSEQQQTANDSSETGEREEYGDTTREDEFEQQTADNTSEQNGPDSEQERELKKPVTAEESNEQSEADRAVEQWLRRVPDDPGGLLRRKFEYQNRGRNRRQQDEDQAW